MAKVKISFEQFVHILPTILSGLNGSGQHDSHVRALLERMHHEASKLQSEVANLREKRHEESVKTLHAMVEIKGTFSGKFDGVHVRPMTGAELAAHFRK